MTDDDLGRSRLRSDDSETARPAGAPSGSRPRPSAAGRPRRSSRSRHPTPRSVVLRLDVPDRIDHLPGQHYVVRLTADDGYTAQRSYSVASPPSDPLVELWVERLDDGEVSAFLADVVAGRGRSRGARPDRWLVRLGRRRCPRWASPAAAVRCRWWRCCGTPRRSAGPELLQLAVSARTLADLPFPDELAAAGAIDRAVPRPTTATGRPGRLTAGGARPAGRTGRDHLRLRLGGVRRVRQPAAGRTGLPSADVRVERFGPSG